MKSIVRSIQYLANCFLKNIVLIRSFFRNKSKSIKGISQITYTIFVSDGTRGESILKPGFDITARA